MVYRSLGQSKKHRGIAVLNEMYYSHEFENIEHWIKLVKTEKVYPSVRIPYDTWFNAYLSDIKNKSENDVNELLRILLRPFTTQLDVYEYKGMLGMVNDKTRWDALEEDAKATLITFLTKNEKNRRLNKGFDAWDGLTWVLQLLPYRPFKAIRALNSYFDAECGIMPDDRIIGISQAIDIIEARYITDIRNSPNCVEKEKALLGLKPREFEKLIENLYRHLGYDTVLTPASRDGGKDIIATIKREEGFESVYAECKLYKTTKLKTESVNALYGVICTDNINRGVMYCTGYVSDSVRSLQSRIHILSLEEIITLLNAHIGHEWEKLIHAE